MQILENEREEVGLSVVIRRSASSCHVAAHRRPLHARATRSCFAVAAQAAAGMPGCFAHTSSRRLKPKPVTVFLLSSLSSTAAELTSSTKFIILAPPPSNSLAHSSALTPHVDGAHLSHFSSPNEAAGAVPAVAMPS